MIDVLLINLPIQSFMQKSSKLVYEFNPSLGLLSVMAYLEFHGINCKIIDLANEKFAKTDFEKKVLELKPKLIGISTYSENINLAIKFSRRLKTIYQQCKIVLGGPHVTLSLDEVENSKYVDFAICGEGECSFLELYEAIVTDQKLIKYENIDGLVYRNKEKFIKNKKREFITELDLLPIVYRGKYPDEYYEKNETINLYTSRGCPGQCIYCSASALSGAKYRVRDIKNVFMELIMCLDMYKTKSFFMVDDSFTVIKERINEYLDLYKKYNCKFAWFCESIANSMTEELLEKMSQNGCISVQYGMETANKEIQRKIHKNVNLEHAMKLIKKTSELGMEPCVSFIFGHYCDTKETMKETADLIKYLDSNYNDIEIGIGYNTPFPGTYQYVHKEELGYKFETENLDCFTLLRPIIYTDNFTADDQRNIVFEIRNCINKKGKKIYAEYYKRQQTCIN